MRIKDLLKYHYIYIKCDTIHQYFSKAHILQDEGNIFRLADLYIIAKSRIVDVKEKMNFEETANGYFQKQCCGSVEIVLDNNEVIELGIAADNRQ